MKVFISWSGERSQALANALRDWLPNVIQAIKPWMSSADIDKGSRWGTDIAFQLSEAKVGLICLTPENLNAPWILFEAGALSKTLDRTYVCPYLFQVEKTEIKGPLVQFQATEANKVDTKELIHTINRALGDTQLSKEKLDIAFEIWWPKFEEFLKDMPDTEVKPEPKRSELDIVEEILELVRGMTRDKRTVVYRPQKYNQQIGGLGFSALAQMENPSLYTSTSGLASDMISTKGISKKIPKEDKELEEKK